MNIDVAEDGKLIVCAHCNAKVKAVVCLPLAGENEDQAKLNERYELCFDCVQRIADIADEFPEHWREKHE